MKWLNARWQELTGRYKKGFFLWIFCVFLFGISILCTWLVTKNLYDQQAADRWSKETEYAQISCFYPVSMALSEFDFLSLHHKMEDALKAESMEAASEGAKLFVDAYSVSGKLTMFTESQQMEVTAVGVSDEFFLFHPLELLAGSYFDENMIMKDGVILDETAAFRLYGSNDVVGMPIFIGNSPYYIRGVAALDDSYFAKKAGLSSSVCFVTMETMEKQGFVNIAGEGTEPIYAVNMKAPVIIFKNVETIIKNPLNKNSRVLKAVEDAHDRLLSVLTDLYPGELILSFNAGIMHHKMISLIARINGVSPVPGREKVYGPYMAVPFGKVLKGVVVPNTVTKALHTEKYFFRDVSDFTVEEAGHYSSLDNQVKTLKSFNRPIILVDDLLHKGYRMKELDPILKENQVEVVDTVVGVQTGRGRDLMTVKQRTVDSAYFLPNLRCWIDETAVYPYLGGDGIKNRDVTVASQESIPSLNLILPFAVPTFLGGLSSSSLYDYSMVGLENAYNILRTLEEEYQNEFERKLTLKRLGEVITSPKKPDLGSYVIYDENVAASAYVEKDMERLIRMRKMFL